MHHKQGQGRHDGGTMAVSMIARGGSKGQAPKSETIRKTEQVQVLVVDDNDDMRSTLCDILEMNGYKAVSAPDGVEGLALFRSGGFDLVVSDFHMTKMHGPEMLREIRKIDASVPMIMAFGGSKDEEDIAREAGACTVLKKPFDFSALEIAIRKALAH